MTRPKMEPCPTCGVDDYLGVYDYESGWRHVECTKCNYLGPGEGSVRQAIKSHNAKMKLVDCDQCNGSGFDTPGSGYGNVCGKCGGQKSLPAQITENPSPLRRSEPCGTI